MSIIAVDENYEAATDSGVWHNGVRSVIRKFYRGHDKDGERIFAAGVGPASRVAELLMWVTHHSMNPDSYPKPTTDDGETFIVVYPDRKEIWEFYRSGIPFQVEAPYVVGEPAACGGALALMLRGRSSKEALLGLLSMGRFDSIHGPIHSSEDR